MNVIALAAYPSFEQTGLAWRGVDYDAMKFIKAIKDKPINGWATVTIDGKSHRLDEATRHLATEWWGDWAARQIRQNIDLTRVNVALVPVPSSKRTRENPIDDAAVRLAQAIERELPTDTTVVNALWFDEPMKSVSSEGGSRDPKFLFDHLILSEDLDPDLTYVLVDDMLTTGGHLTASAARLGTGGVSVDLAVCAGHRVDEHHADVFAPATYLVDSFVSS